MIVDSHAHYDDEKFDDDRKVVLQRIQEQGVVRVINPASNLSSAHKCMKLAQEYDFLYTAAGIHPHDANTLCDETMNIFRDMSCNKKVVAIGEVGLDYYYDLSPRQVQKECFAAHIQLALEVGLPLIIHDRDAHKDVLDLIKAEKASTVGGVFHCFTGSIEMAKEVLELGFHISLGGAVTFKNAHRPVEVAKYIPDDRILVETDSPYMTPVPYRGKRNDSGYLTEIIHKIAVVRETTDEKLSQVTAANANRLFRLGLHI